MRTMRSLMDRMMGRLVAEIPAAAYTQTRCVSGCGSPGKTIARGCHDASGVCGPWYTLRCGC